MNRAHTDFQTRFDALCRSYVRQLTGQLTEIRTEWRRSQYDCENPQALATMHRIAHTVTGSGATFGFPRVSDKARELKLLLENAIAGEIPIDLDFRYKVEVALAELSRVIPQPPRPSAPVHRDPEA